MTKIAKGIEIASSIEALTISNTLKNNFLFLRPENNEE